MVLYVAGDIGGTNSRLQLIEISDTPLKNNNTKPTETILAEHTYPSAKYVTLTSIVKEFLQAYMPDGKQCNAACFAVAGPVRNNKAHFTNLNWIIDGNAMCADLNITGSVQVINDFVAQGYGLLALTRADIVPINDVPVNTTGPKAVLGAGTGLGEAYLTYSNGTNEYEVWGCEGGHTDFPPRDTTEFELMHWIKNADRVDRVSVERLVSGMGIPRIYDYFAATFPTEVHHEITQRMLTEDKGAVIADAAKNGHCPIAQRTIDTFVQLYGAEAGNLALKTLPFGGLYVGGGIAPKLLWAILKDNQFYANYIAKGRMQKVLEQIPVFVVTHPQVGLLGAQVVCRRIIKRAGELPVTGDSGVQVFSENRPISSIPAHLIDPATKTKHYETKAKNRLKQIESSKYTMRPETPAHSPKRQTSTDSSVSELGLNTVDEEYSGPTQYTVPITTLLAVSILGGIVSTASMVLGYVLVKGANKQRTQSTNSVDQFATLSRH